MDPLDHVKSPIAFRIRNLRKTFNGVTVLHGLDLDIAPGEVRGLIGENGSGKSTFVKIIGGVYTPDPGSLCEVWGNRMPLPTVQPQSHGVAIIHQDLALDDGMSIAENVGISVGFDSRVLAPYRKKRESSIVRELLSNFGLDLNPNILVGSLSPAERSLVAILRGLRVLHGHGGRQVLILDEPTAALPKSESERLLRIIRALAEKGVALIFISHRLNEVLTLCDKVSVLRSGRLVGTVQAAESSESELVKMMLGYDLGAFYPDRHIQRNKPEVLRVRSLSGSNVEDVTLSVKGGEIAGVTGLVGMGQDELPYLINGSARRSTGSVEIAGVEVKRSVPASLRVGLALVPGNRLRDSIWAVGSATENLTLPFVRRFTKGVLNRRKELQFAEREMTRFGVRPVAPEQSIARFSGGNQQKIVLARWLQIAPRVLILHEPTQGVDAGAKKEIFQLIQQVADTGAAILIVSTDVEEVANVCHRVLIMRHGKIAEELVEGQLSQEQIMSACQGVELIA